MRAIKLYNHIEDDHTLRVGLPEDVEAGSAEVNVLVPEVREQSRRSLVEDLDKIALHCAGLPVQDSRMPNEILEYDEHGLTR